MDISICTVWVSPTAGLLHPVAVPGCQSPLFLALGHMSPQSCSFIPAAGTDTLTHTCTGAHTEHTHLASLLQLAQPHSSCRSCFGLPLSTSSHLTPRDTHIDAHTPQRVLHPGKELERGLESQREVQQEDRTHFTNRVQGTAR